MTVSFEIGQTDAIASDFQTNGLCKLYHYGICGHLLTWLVIWLANYGILIASLTKTVSFFNI